MKNEHNTAGVIAFPPLIYGIPLAASVLADRLIFKKRLPAVSQIVAAGFFAGAISLFAPAVGEFKKAGTPVDPFEETKALVATGPFANTRNPLYLGLTLTYVAVALAFRASLPLAVLPAVLSLMNAGVIEREERYLERKFGESYRKYKEQVPRWF